MTPGVRLIAAMAVALGASNAGCIVLLLDDDRSDRGGDPAPLPPSGPPSAPPPAASATDLPPSIEEIRVPSWPPVGPSGLVRVSASDDVRLAQAQAIFARTTIVALSGSFDTASFSGTALGEGLGELLVRVTDANGGWAERRVTNLLVDLSPPTIQRFETTVPATGERARVGLWVADAWVLGTVSLSFLGETAIREFPKAYPSTLGDSWDGSLVEFDASTLPTGRGVAVVVARDAAGNSTTDEFTLHVDGVPPVVAIADPAPGAVVSGSFDFTVVASDALGGRVWVELQAGGAPLARAAGSATVTLDAAELPAGPTELRAVPLDEAGNEGVAATVAIVVARD